MVEAAPDSENCLSLSRQSSRTARGRFPKPGRLGRYKLRNNLMVRILKSLRVGMIFLAMGIGCFIGTAGISSYFMGARPGIPQPESGMIYAFNQHGGIVYLTHVESLLPKVLFVAAAIFIAVGGYIYNNWRADRAKFR